MLQVKGYYDKSKHAFDCESASLVVPWFGPIPMVSNVVFDLKKSAYVRVNVGRAVKGKIKIEYGADDTQVAISYDLSVAFIGGRLQDTIPLFPTFGIFSSHLKLYVTNLSRSETKPLPTR